MECKKCGFTFEQKRPEDFVCYTCVPTPSPASICIECKEGFQPEKDYYTTCRPCFEKILTKRKSERTDRHRSPSRDRNNRGYSNERGRSFDRFRDQSRDRNRDSRPRNDRSYDRRDSRRDTRREGNDDRRDYSDKRGRDHTKRSDNKDRDQRRDRRDSHRSTGSEWKSFHRSKENSQDRNKSEVNSEKKVQDWVSKNEKSGFEPDKSRKEVLCISSGPLNGQEYVLYTDKINNHNLKEAVDIYKLDAEHSRLITMAEEGRSGHRGKALFDSGANLNTVTHQFLLECEKKCDFKFEVNTNTKKVRDFEGKECNTLGTVLLNILLGEASYKAEFTIIKGHYGCEIILGTPFLSSFNILSSMRDQIISVMRSKNTQ